MSIENKSLYKMREKWSRQSWYSEDTFKLSVIHTDRNSTKFGTHCTWINLRTEETINIWNTCMVKLNKEDFIRLTRGLNLEKLGI